MATSDEERKTCDAAYAAGNQEGKSVSVAENLIRDAARLIGDRTRKEQGLPERVESELACAEAAAAIKDATRTDAEPSAERPGFPKEHQSGIPAAPEGASSSRD